jgi:hypothetical protein
MDALKVAQIGQIVTARYLQVYDLQIYDVSLPRNYGSPRVRILRPHRSSLVFPIRQLYESRPRRFSATLDVLGNDLGLYPCRRPRLGT